MTTSEHASWQAMEIRRPSQVPAATPLAWQVEKHTEHNDRLMNNALPADFPYDVQRGDLGDALAVIALRESIRRDIEMQRCLRVRDAIELGATWTEVADALDMTPDEARRLLRAWVEGQLQLHRGDVARGESHPLGLDDERAVEILLWCQRGDDERPKGGAQDVKSTPEASHTDERADKGCTHPADEPCFGKRRPGAFIGCDDCGAVTTCAPAEKCWRGKLEAYVSTYRLVVNAEERTRGTLRDVRAVIAELVTVRLAEEPDRVALDAQTVSMAFNSGAVEQALAEKGDWYTVFDAFGETPLRIRVTKE